MRSLSKADWLRYVLPTAESAGFLCEASQRLSHTVFPSEQQICSHAVAA